MFTRHDALRVRTARVSQVDEQGQRAAGSECCHDGVKAGELGHLDVVGIPGARLNIHLGAFNNSGVRGRATFCAENVSVGGALWARARGQCAAGADVHQRQPRSRPVTSMTRRIRYVHRWSRECWDGPSNSASHVGIASTAGGRHCLDRLRLNRRPLTALRSAHFAANDDLVVSEKVVVAAGVSRPGVVSGVGSTVCSWRGMWMSFWRLGSVRPSWSVGRVRGGWRPGFVLCRC
jgi:hypothetical protein